MPTQQRTIRKERTIKGKSLHTGEDVSLTIKPADIDQGLIFRRIDLFGKPEMPLYFLIVSKSSLFIFLIFIRADGKNRRL